MSLARAGEDQSSKLEALNGVPEGSRIIALTPSEVSLRQLASLWGVEPYLLEACPPVSDDFLVRADCALLEYKLAERDEAVVVMAGRMSDRTISLSMKLHQVGELTEIS